MHRDTLTAPVETVEGDSSTFRQDLLAVEEPLEIQLNGKPLSITMRTPGDDPELTTGFLLTEGIIEDVDQILSMRQADDSTDAKRAGNSIRVELKPGVHVDPELLLRNFYTTSSCGVCGKVSINALQAMPRRPLAHSRPLVPSDVIHRLPDLLRDSQSVFNRTGGLHAAALFAPDGTLLAVREDIGRHNAVDKLIGFALRCPALPLSDSMMFVSGRAGFELVQKAVMAGIPILAAVGAPPSLAVEAAQRFRMTLLGFVRGERFNIYSGAWRIKSRKTRGTTDHPLATSYGTSS